MSILDNEGHDPQGFLNTPEYRTAPKCKLCNDTGEQRYWEGRWRDEKAENELLRAALEKIIQQERGQWAVSPYQIARAALA